MSYRRMPDRLYDDPDELATWARAALAAAGRSGTGKSSAQGWEEAASADERDVRAHATLLVAGLETSGSASLITRLRPLRLAA